jgi:hypothetical protein
MVICVRFYFTLTPSTSPRRIRILYVRSAFRPPSRKAARMSMSREIIPVTFGIEIFPLCYRFGQFIFGETRNVTDEPV